MRVVEVWLDPEYREYFYTREPTVRGYPIGDVSKQVAFKKQHKCRSFKWFLENVAYEVLEKFPPPPPNIGWGEVSQLSYCDDCMLCVVVCVHVGTLLWLWLFLLFMRD